MNGLVRVHADTNQILWIDNVWIAGFQIDRLHRIHVMNVDASIYRVFAVPHVKTVVSNDDLVADGLPLTTSIEPLVQPTISTEGSFAHSLLDAQVAISREVVIEREKLLSRPEFHRDTPS